VTPCMMANATVKSPKRTVGRVSTSVFGDCSNSLPFGRKLGCFSPWHDWLHLIRNIQGGPKNWHNFLYALAVPNINRLSKLFHRQNPEKIWPI